MPIPNGFTEIPNPTPPAGFSDVTNEPDWGGVVKQALNEATMGDDSKIRSLMTDPITQAKVLPVLAGSVGAVTGIPMGATAGTVGGRQLSNAALRSYGREDQIPSTNSQVLEGALSAAGDLTAIPAMNRKIFGGQVGAAEIGAGVPPPQDIPSIPTPTGQKSVGDFINDAVSSVKTAGEGSSPSYWKQIKDQVDRIYKLGKDQPLTTLDKGRLNWLSDQVQDGLNASVSGRAAPAASLAMSQTVPNAIGNVTRTMPWWAKATAAGVGGDALVRTLSNLGKK